MAILQVHSHGGLVMPGRKPRGHFLNAEESFMYDREARFPMEETTNAAMMEYALHGVTHLAQRRCNIIRISRSSAIIGVLTRFGLPQQFYLDIPDARIRKIGCLLMRSFINDTAEIRFLRLLSMRELNRIFAFSTHPRHRDIVLDAKNG